MTDYCSILNIDIHIYYTHISVATSNCYNIVKAFDFYYISYDLSLMVLRKDLMYQPFIHLHLYMYSSSSRMRFMSHNWSATKQRLHPQSVAEISHHSVF